MLVHSANSSNHLEVIASFETSRWGGGGVAREQSYSCCRFYHEYEIHKVKKSFQIYCGTLNYQKNSVCLFHVKANRCQIRTLSKANALLYDKICPSISVLLKKSYKENDKGNKSNTSEIKLIYLSKEHI